jgi:predicted RNA-binding protein (TIGR00451 family)
MGARAILERLNPPPSRVVVRSEVGDFIREGRSVFARHVVGADPELRPGDEAIVLDERGGLLGVGRALMSAAEMLSASRGVAVRIRRGACRGIARCGDPGRLKRAGLEGR